MRKASKKELAKHWPKKGQLELIHSEGNHWCDCRIRNYRLWLGLKLYGKKSIREDE